MDEKFMQNMCHCSSRCYSGQRVLANCFNRYGQRQLEQAAGPISLRALRRDRDTLLVKITLRLMHRGNRRIYVK